MCGIGFAGRRSRWLLAASATLVAFPGIMGCGRGDGRQHISGRVTYRGQPVVEGSISFDPVGGGGGGFAPIRDGVYNTSVEGRSHSGGPHRVSIVGYQPARDSRSPDADVVILFRPYTTTAELPTKRATMDFDVPASHRP
jgi:hypothetical protein